TFTQEVEDITYNAAIYSLALGDTHATMEMGSTGSVWFSGSPETTDYKHLPDGGGESDSGNDLVVTIEKNSASDVEVSVVKEAIGQWVLNPSPWISTVKKTSSALSNSFRIIPINTAP